MRALGSLNELWGHRISFHFKSTFSKQTFRVACARTHPHAHLKYVYWPFIWHWRKAVTYRGLITATRKKYSTQICTQCTRISTRAQKHKFAMVTFQFDLSSLFWSQIIIVFFSCSFFQFGHNKNLPIERSQSKS